MTVQHPQAGPVPERTQTRTAAPVKSTFLPRLVNGPFGDPGLHVSLRWQGTAVQLDLGRIDRVPAGALLKVTHIFVTHTHIDHFIGFDRVLRLFLARSGTLAIFGPQGIIANVRGKLAGYTWNLVDGYPFVLEVHEVGVDTIRTVRLPATGAFEPEDLGSRPFTGVLYEEAAFTVKATILDHRIPCLGFALAEAVHLNVRTDALEQLGVPPGRWLNDLKDAVRTGQPADTPITARWRRGGVAHEQTFDLRDLRDRLLAVTPGQKVAYVTDTIFSRANAARVTALVEGADVFFCESLFLDQDREEAAKRYHLTARQAGTLARMAGVKRLQVFHFSPRYGGMADRLYAEADAAFRGLIAPDEPA